jgi:hypothetical protein
MRNHSGLLYAWFVFFLALPSAAAGSAWHRAGLLIAAAVLVVISYYAIKRHERERDAERLRPRARPPATIDHRRRAS